MAAKRWRRLLGLFGGPGPGGGGLAAVRVSQDVAEVLGQRLPGDAGGTSVRVTHDAVEVIDQDLLTNTWVRVSQAVAEVSGQGSGGMGLGAVVRVTQVVVEVIYPYACAGGGLPPIPPVGCPNMPMPDAGFANVGCPAPSQGA